jgi:hypothetical protein
MEVDEEEEEDVEMEEADEDGELTAPTDDVDDNGMLLLPPYRIYFNFIFFIYMYYL